MGGKLTQKERVLLHLLKKHSEWYMIESESSIGKWELTQEGIAHALGISRNNVPRLLNTLVKEGYVERKKMRVHGVHHKRFVYYLTEKGFEIANSVYRKISEEPFK